MPYLTEEELQDYGLQGDVIANSTPELRDTHIVAASRIADVHLRAAGYNPSLSNWDEAVKMHVAHIAVYTLTKKLGHLPEPVKDSSEWMDYDRALRWFESVSSGHIDLGAEDQDGNTLSTGPLVASQPPRGW
jgi:phage gp36-like protein